MTYATLTIDDEATAIMAPLREMLLVAAASACGIFATLALLAMLPSGIIQGLAAMPMG